MADNTTPLTKTIPSYIYWQYADDDDIQAWIAAYNTNTQEYVDWFNSINLPIYTGAPISGAMLDWVAAGLYGLIRPVIGDGINVYEGPFNTYAFNTLAYNQQLKISEVTYAGASDDVFKRVITWHFFKGDGKVFNIRWLKRRIMRFLIGTNGTAPIIDQTYLVSVTFGTDGEVSIRLLTRKTVITGGSIYNTFAFNENIPLNTINKQTTVIAPEFALARVLKDAIEQGVLETPFQFKFDVQVAGSYTPPPFNI